MPRSDPVIEAELERVRCSLGETAGTGGPPVALDAPPPPKRRQQLFDAEMQRVRSKNEQLLQSEIWRARYEWAARIAAGLGVGDPLPGRRPQ